MVKCSFCGKDFSSSTGTLFVTRIGKKHYFCSRKCETNLLKLKRNPRTTRWTKTYETFKEQSSG